MRKNVDWLRYERIPTGAGTRSLLVQGPTLQPAEPSGQGPVTVVLKMNDAHTWAVNKRWIVVRIADHAGGPSAEVPLNLPAEYDVLGKMSVQAKRVVGSKSRE